MKEDSALKRMISNYSDKYCEIKALKHKWENNEEWDDSAFEMHSLLNVYIEPTNACNLRCYFCARSKMSRGISYLSYEMFQRIVDSLPPGNYITLTGNGEPLLNKKVYDMIAYAANKGFIVSMITNGIALTEKNARKLIESGISRVQFSFDSVDKNTYEEMRKGAKFEDALHKILRFIHLAREAYHSDLFISISSVQTEKVKEHAEASRKFWKEMPIDNYYESPLYSLQNDSAAYSEIRMDRDEAWKPCITPWISVKVNADGTVSGCQHDFSGKYMIGSLNEKNLLDIINSPRAIALRKALFSHNEACLDEIGYACGQCNVWRKGNGYNVCEFLEDTYPIRLSLVITEMTRQKTYSVEKLREVLNAIESGGNGIDDR